MAELQVSRKNIANLLNLQNDKVYVIPEYQRPYRWGENECDTLWSDINNFFIDKVKHSDNDNYPKEYFIGTIVTCADANNKNEIDIIDGQQRITSLLLLLRAFYTKLQLSQDKDKADGLKRQIEPCIWRTDPLTTKVNDFNNIKLDSRVALDKDCEDLKNILSTGKEPQTKSAYSQNYSFFLRKCEEYASDMNDWYNLCLTILKDCIVFPIECEDLNSALTIFSTLNNRGLPLSDSDIFKAELYKLQTTPTAKSDFTDAWKELEGKGENGGFTINDIFRYYTHVIRAREGKDDNELGLRRFYAGDDYKYSEFKKDGFFDNIISLADFWCTINENVLKFDKDNEFCTLDAIKWVHCLTNYPNDYWRCAVTVYYFKYRYDADFKLKFEAFLRQLMSYMIVLFVVKPQVNAIKKPIYSLCIDISKGNSILFNKDIPTDFGNLLDAASKGSSRIVKSVILLNSYLYDPESPLLTGKLEIEHILPQKWKSANYEGWTKDDADEYLESIGNKIPFEKRLNIQAGNGYFGEKKKKYIESPIKEVQDLCKHDSNNWLPDDIKTRRDKLCDRIIKFFGENLSGKMKNIDSEEVLMSLSKGKESIVLEKITNGSIVNYRMISCRYITNPTPQQAMMKSVPLAPQKIDDYNNLDDAIKDIDFNFYMDADKNLLPEFEKYLENMKN